MRRIDPWIGGESWADRCAERFVVTSPIHGEVIAEVAMCQAPQVEAAIASADAAALAWSRRSSTERGQLLVAIGRAMREHAEELIAAECDETGKLRSEMTGLLATSAEYFEYYGGVVKAFFGDTLDLGGGQHAFTRREPYGVVGMITPWNGPLSQASRGVAAALAAGNTVVLKPSEFTSATSVLLARICSECGLPPGVFNVVTGTGAEAGSLLVRHPRTALIAFTGSANVGRLIARECASQFKPSILELGGKSPNIVFPDSDLAKAAASAASICVGVGQQCAALSRLLVHESVEEEMVARVQALLERKEPGPSLGPLTTPAQLAKVLDYFQVAQAEGARLVTGGRAATQGALARGRYVYPTLYTGVRPAMRIFREEIFGPVLSVTTFRSEAEAVALANDSEFGLVSSLWTRDISRALRIAARLETGQVMVNGGRTGVETPFGGYKASGWGREKGFESLQGYTRSKTTVVAIDLESEGSAS